MVSIDKKELKIEVDEELKLSRKNLFYSVVGGRGRVLS